MTRQQLGAAAAPPTVVGAAPPGAPARGGGRRLPRVLVALLAAAAVALAVVAVVLYQRADSADDGVTTAADRLLALALPGDLTPGDCTAQEPRDGELRRLSCPDGSPDAALPAGTYTVVADGSAGEAVSATVERLGLAEFETSLFQCGSEDTPDGYLVITDFDETVYGSVACYVDEASNDAVLVWAWEDLGIRGQVSVPGGDVDDLGDLANWWSNNADRGI